jgi:hypothetical protein
MKWTVSVIYIAYILTVDIQAKNVLETSKPFLNRTSLCTTYNIGRYNTGVHC